MAYPEQEMHAIQQDDPYADGTAAYEEGYPQEAAAAAGEYDDPAYAAEGDAYADGTAGDAYADGAAGGYEDAGYPEGDAYADGAAGDAYADGGADDAYAADGAYAPEGEPEAVDEWGEPQEEAYADDAAYPEGEEAAAGIDNAYGQDGQYDIPVAEEETFSEPEVYPGSGSPPTAEALRQRDADDKAKKKQEKEERKKKEKADKKAKKEKDREDRRLMEEEEYEDKRRRRKERGNKEKWTCYRYLAKIGRTIGFSTWFRLYVLLCLYSSTVFFFFLGYHYMLADTFRMVVPPADKNIFLVSMSFLAHFFCVLIMTATYMHLHCRLIVSWLGTTPETANILFLPNGYRTEEKAMMYRDFQLVVLEIALLLVPLIYSIMVVLMNGESILTFVGHFSYCSFLVTELVVFLIWLYFWWRSLRAKNKAWRKGTLGVKSNRERGHDTDTESEDEDQPIRSRKKRRNDDDDSDDDSEDDVQQRRKKKRSKKRAEAEENDGQLRVMWRRRRLANPEVMSEFGADLYSLQAYIVHVMIGVVWVLISLYPTSLTINAFEWVAITLVVVMGALVMLRLNISKTKAKRIATRQRLASFVLWIVGGIFSLFAFISGVTTIPAFGAVLLVSLIFIQFFTVRRHDMHIRGQDEAGRMVLPYSNNEMKEKKLRDKLGNPSVCLPMFPCSNVLRACFGSGWCLESEPIDPAGDTMIYQRESLTSNKLIPVQRMTVPMDERNGTLDKIIRPKAQPGFKLNKNDASAFVENAKGKEKLAREEYLNQRERVHQASLVFTTWYLLFFIVVVGMTYGFGDWMAEVTPTIAENGAAYKGIRNYPVCSARWGPGLTVQDFALLNLIVEATDEITTIETWLSTWFRQDGKALRLNNAFATTTDNFGAPVKYNTFFGYDTVARANLDLAPDYVIVVLNERGFGSEWMRDVDYWADAALYQILSSFIPFLSTWHLEDQKSFVKATSNLKEIMDGDSNVLKNVLLYTKNIRMSLFNFWGGTDADKQLIYDRLKTIPLFITGSGTHGGWARMLTKQLEEDLPMQNNASVITFGSPNILLTEERLSLSEKTLTDDIAVQPRGGILSMVDKPSGFIQETMCDSGNSITTCQSIHNIACDLLRSCGDSLGRKFGDFNSDALAAQTCKY